VKEALSSTLRLWRRPKLHDGMQAVSLKRMKANPLKDGALTENSAGIGTVTPQMVRERAVELAVINGRLAKDVSKVDLEQARRELTGDSDSDPREAILESAPESVRWDPVPGSTGHKVPATPSDDEDAEGRSDNEKLVEEGVAGGEHDQLRQASSEASQRYQPATCFAHRPQLMDARCSDPDGARLRTPLGHQRASDMPVTARGRVTAGDQ
jgi:hypothetical protein